MTADNNFLFKIAAKLLLLTAAEAWNSSSPIGYPTVSKPYHRRPLRRTI